MRSALLLASAVALAGCEAKSPDAATEMASAPVPASVTEQPEPVQSARIFPTPAPAKRFQALGTEPFWSVEVVSGQLHYSDPENIDGTTFSASESRFGEGRSYSGTLEGQPVELLIEPGTCSDGMSDTVYPWKARLTLGKRTLQGCARER